MALARLRGHPEPYPARNTVEQDPKRPFQVGDKVKKQYFTRVRFPGRPVEIWEDFHYGTIVFLETNSYASVCFRHQRTPEIEMLSDLIHVSEQEWRRVINQ